MIFTPRRFLSETYEIWTGDAVMVSYLVAPHPGKETFRIIHVGLSLVAEAMGFLRVYPAQREPRGAHPARRLHRRRTSSAE
jgi:hypothetical protein